MSLTNYDKVDAPFGILELGHPYLTEFAQETEQFLQSMDPLAFALPSRTVYTKEVRVEWTEQELRVLGVVRSGQKNQLNTFGKGKEFNFTPALFRRGDLLDMELINHLRQAGEDQKEYGMTMVEDRLIQLVEQGELMMSVLRAQLLSGGINYVDYETNNSVVADPGIPAGNLYTVGAGMLAGSAKWSDMENAKPVDDFQTLTYLMKIEGKNPVTHCVMSGAMRQVLSRNKQIRQFLPDTDTGLFNLGLVKFGEDGLVSKIAGVTIIEHNMLFDDYVDGVITRQFMWPVNKVSFFSTSNPALPSQKLGYSVLTKGEHPFGGTGLWVRSLDASHLPDPTMPPGLSMQVGMAGLPVLYKPWWVHIVTACDVADLTGQLGSKYIV